VKSAVLNWSASPVGRTASWSAEASLAASAEKTTLGPLLAAKDPEKVWRRLSGTSPGGGGRVDDGDVAALRLDTMVARLPPRAGANRVATLEAAQLLFGQRTTTNSA
jgi:hypothetical protein